MTRLPSQWSESWLERASYVSACNIVPEAFSVMSGRLVGDLHERLPAPEKAL